MPPRVADSVRGDTPTRGECAGEWRELPQETHARAAEVVADGVREARHGTGDSAPQCGAVKGTEAHGSAATVESTVPQSTGFGALWLGTVGSGNPPRAQSLPTVCMGRHTQWSNRIGLARLTQYATERAKAHRAGGRTDLPRGDGSTVRGESVGEWCRLPCHSNALPTYLATSSRCR